MATAAAWEAVRPLAERLCWPRVLRWLEDTTPERLAERARAVASLTDAAVDPHQLLAALILLSSPSRLADAVAVAADGPLNPADSLRLHTWLRSTAHFAYGRGPRQSCKRRERVEAIAETAPGGLVVDPALPPLPLMDLARDIAAQYPGGLVMSVGRLHSLHGLSAEEAGTAVVVIDLEAIAASRKRKVEETAAHELAHFLDPRRRSPEWALDHEEQERFANTLGPLLLAREPSSVAECAPLIAEALGSSPAAPAADDELASLLFFLSRDLAA
jgi:hypothetical protein